MSAENIYLSDEEILRAVKDTRSQWIALLAEQEADNLGQWLAKAATDDPEAVRQATNRVLDLLQKHPQARSRVSGELGVKGGLSLRGYRPPAGEHAPPASTLLVCPQDPGHYRKRLHQKGQKLFCPEHGLPLVPADSIEAD